MLVFSNPGELDPRLIQTFGVSIKESTNPFGFFGTGLKYALAVLLRSKHQVTIWSGDLKLTFTTKKTTLRGQEVELVYMEDPTGPAVQMPFSLELGKNWEVWMAYRELVCNARDEGGDVDTAPNGNHDDYAAQGALVDHTHILVSGRPIEEVHKVRHKYFISGEPILKTPGVEVYARSGSDIFYRGVKVGETKQPGLYTYNVIEKVKLTEDRTLAELYRVVDLFGNTWYECQDEAKLKEILLAKDTSLEGNLSFHSWHFEPRRHKTFLKILQSLLRSHVAGLSKSAKDLAESIAPTKMEPRRMTRSPTEEKMLQRAMQCLNRMGFEISFSEINCAEDLGAKVMGVVLGNTIWISRLAFRMGTKQLAGTIYEEWIHKTMDLSDCTRGLQNHLIDALMSMGEEKMGEPF